MTFMPEFTDFFSFFVPSFGIKLKSNTAIDATCKTFMEEGVP